MPVVTVEQRGTAKRRDRILMMASVVAHGIEQKRGRTETKQKGRAERTGRNEKPAVSAAPIG
jgi:hypothetical protein